MVRCANTAQQYSRLYCCLHTSWVLGNRSAFCSDLRGTGGVLMKKWFIFIVCFWGGQASAQGTYTATGCSQTAIAAAITAEQASAKDGDIISIPAGSCTWTTPISVAFNSSVTIQGAGAISATTGGASTTGTDQTVIINHNGNNPAIAITTTAGKSFRFTGIAVLEDSGSSSKNDGNVIITGQSSAVRVDHSHFNVFIGGSKGLAIEGGVTGVADHVYINTSQDVTFNFLFDNGANWKNDPDPNGFGDKSWTDTDNFGTSQFFYVEDSQISGGGLNDCGTGGRYVIRYSTVLNTHGSYNHGTYNQYRGCRAMESYQNNFNNTSTTEGGGIEHNDGGTSMLWGNTVTGSGSGGFGNIVNFGPPRTVGNYGTGGSPYPPNGWGLCGDASQSSGTETSPWDGNSNSTTGYPCMDSSARGAGDLLSGNFPPNGSGICNITLNPACNVFTGQYPRQALVPVYVWGNTLSGSQVTGIVGFANSISGFVQSSALLADNRDYYQQFGALGESGTFNGTKGVGQGLLSARPATCTAGTDPQTHGGAPGVGYWATDTNTLYVCNPTNTWTAYYTPYTYPHPLTHSSTGATVAAPTNLSATVN
jgi:hypothetical protein